VKIGIIGLGAIAPYFLAALEADRDWDLVAVCDLDESKLAPFRSAGVATFTDHRDLLSSGLAEAVVITLPNDLHHPVAAAALAAGLHVCCEKPLTVAPAHARELAALARSAQRVLFTAYHRRYNMHVQRLAAQVAAAGSPVVAVRAHYEENIAEHTGGDSWYLDAERCGGGCLIDNGPNALDAVRHVVGPLSLVDATIGDVRAGVEFCAELRLRTAAAAGQPDGSEAPVHIVLDWARATGERKDIEVELADGRVLSVDMLAGFTGFKSSLAHEYAAILADFARAVADPATYTDLGPETVHLVDTAYRMARRKERRQRMSAKQPLGATLVKLLFHSRDERRMRLSRWSSRCVRAGDVHELVTTTDRPRRSGDRVDRVGFLGFATFPAAGVIERGDRVYAGERLVGTVAGFDECHAPNHLNILIDFDRVLTAADLDLAVGAEITFMEGTDG
jgi:predicted dehydrogenase